MIQFFFSLIQLSDPIIRTVSKKKTHNIAVFITSDTDDTIDTVWW